MQPIVLEHCLGQSVGNVFRFFKSLPGKSHDNAEEWGLSFQMMGETLIILPGNIPQTLPGSLVGKESSIVTIPSLKKHVPPFHCVHAKCVHFGVL